MYLWILQRSPKQSEGTEIQQCLQPSSGKDTFCSSSLRRFPFGIYRLGGIAFCNSLKSILGFPGGASGKESTWQCRRHRAVVLIPGSGRFPGEGNGNPLQYSCLENSVDREAWWVAVHQAAKESETTEQPTPAKGASGLC